MSDLLMGLGSSFLVIGAGLFDYRFGMVAFGLLCLFFLHERRSQSLPKTSSTRPRG